MIYAFGLACVKLSPTGEVQEVQAAAAYVVTSGDMDHALELVAASHLASYPPADGYAHHTCAPSIVAVEWMEAEVGGMLVDAPGEIVHLVEGPRADQPIPYPDPSTPAGDPPGTMLVHWTPRHCT